MIKLTITLARSVGPSTSRLTSNVYWTNIIIIIIIIIINVSIENKIQVAASDTVEQLGRETSSCTCKC